MKILSRVISGLRVVRAFRQQTSANWLVSVVNKFVPLLCFLSLAMLLWKANDLPPLVPFWYAKPWGEEQLANPWWLLVLPITSLVVYLLNMVAGAYLTAEHLVFTQLLYATSLFVAFLSFVTLAKILFLVT